ncbi:hypothetical protein BKA82DRAFT_996737 [Pisolithus tinctorius]|uniref:UDENN domain-containing protein n=1 Tax=Pisolithus tinctorius Marx 270 TaxID=870435 RepID=A0A0C3P6R0_PISTI|nr:hypothetical protein BKA82DRAFT_996737 [Pisolithus tinctorius]KIO09020.1 hypothetical protein M404DRAFT_996737 [Pisolithus tinctorius Marx 270]
MTLEFDAKENLQEQDIGLYYSPSTLTFSDAETSSAVSLSRQASQVHLELSLTPYHALAHLKSTSTSNVMEFHDEKRESHQRTLSRSRSFSLLMQNGGGQKSTEVGSFDFPHDKVLKMRQWVLAFAVVDFDLDLGPVVRSVCPPVYLSPSETENIAFSAFPDSLQFDQGTEVHSFRIRVFPDSLHTPCQDSFKRPEPLDGFMYGFSYFSQKRDSNSKRGYRQSSLVLLTHHQYPAFFTSVVSKLGPLFQNHGITMLETGCHNVANWPSPSPGSTLELGFLGSVLHVELPTSIDSQQLVETASFGGGFDPTEHLLASSVPLYPPSINLFEASLSHLWSVWECLILCEPILVYGPSPSMTSQAVWWLRDLIRPIPLAADIRPYFTIHDRDHALLVNKSPPKTGLVIGVTNPFFEKSCTHWPHVLSVGRKTRPGTTVVAGPSAGWTTKTHRRYISKDRQLLKRLEKACTSSTLDRMQASLELRRHFCSRTNAVLVPLNRYLNTLIPSPAERNTTLCLRRLKPFNTAEFFSSLRSSPSALPFKSSSKQREFYEKWLRTPAFGLWLARQEEVVQDALRQKT